MRAAKPFVKRPSLCCCLCRPGADPANHDAPMKCSTMLGRLSGTMVGLTIATKHIRNSAAQASNDFLTYTTMLHNIRGRKGCCPLPSHVDASLSSSVNLKALTSSPMTATSFPSDAWIQMKGKKVWVLKGKHFANDVQSHSPFFGGAFPCSIPSLLLALHFSPKKQAM